MSEVWIPAAVAAAAALLSSALTGYIGYRLARAERLGRGDDELRSALAAFGYAVDRLQIELDQLPPAPGRSNRWVLSRIERARELDWLLGQVSRHTLGRPALRAVDGLMAASNRLVLVAPEEILHVVEAIHVLVGQVNDRDEAWRQRWIAARGELLRLARLHTGAPLPAREAAATER